MPPKRKSASNEASVSVAASPASGRTRKTIKVRSPHSPQERSGAEIPSASPKEDGTASSRPAVDQPSTTDAGEEKLVVAETVAWPGNRGHELLDFSSELPKEVLTNLDILLKRLDDLNQFVENWVKINAAEKAKHFSTPLEEENMTLWMFNAVVSLGEVYCRLNGLDLEKEGINKRKELLERYARKFTDLEPHASLFARTESGPSSRLDIPAVQRFLKPALVADDGNKQAVRAGDTPGLEPDSSSTVSSPELKPAP
ncbi:uncharacterized protein LOC129581285 [Paramacrobiotus metropolitanus]|uniref:uncharacterized protein LOC129581285 n=1 Tax=Paramacrobiotus metropolitanus TaxID=2943436 RepID=UPI0024463D23|nr:uncharacterized protein LOC129581285 [Paramacrobiotus metropolitanus]